ncbi:MAG: hypothetical protein FVQ80_02390 [Planctomycetes bacterium]|nr:hypothetical protein [Planctomycetota bacterium]
MTEKPTVAPGDWITFGNNISAVVCTIYENTSLGEIEVVYIDSRDRAINADMVWRDGKWEFKSSEVCGGYADKYTRLEQFVSKLRSGRFR